MYRQEHFEPFLLHSPDFILYLHFLFLTPFYQFHVDTPFSHYVVFMCLSFYFCFFLTTLELVEQRTGWAFINPLCFNQKPLSKCKHYQYSLNFSFSCLI